MPCAIEKPSRSVTKPILQRWRPPDRSRSQYKGHDNDRMRTCPRQSHTTETRQPFDALVMAATNNNQEQTKPQPGHQENTHALSLHISNNLLYYSGFSRALNLTGENHLMGVQETIVRHQCLWSVTTLKNSLCFHLCNARNGEVCT